MHNRRCDYWLVLVSNGNFDCILHGGKDRGMGGGGGGGGGGGAEKERHITVNFLIP